MRDNIFPTFLVRVSCMTYNHSAYIIEAMDGFCMQNTDFPYVCIIIDDASTDGEPEIIKKYIEKNFKLEDRTITCFEETDDYKLTFAHHKTNKNCYFAFFSLKYNHYSIKKSKSPYWQRWSDTKYIALCEGDDYWTDPLKLQKQVYFLEKHPDYTMVCNRTQLLSERQKTFIGENYCYIHDRKVKTKDIIYRSGLFISTCSIVFRKDIQENYPYYCIKCAVGDYPLQIMAAMRGNVYYFNDIMSVYRIQNSNSWMASQKWHSADEKNLRRIDSMINMFKGFSFDYPKYKKNFNNKIAQYLISQSPYRFTQSDKDLNLYLQYYKKEYKQFPLFWKFVNILRMNNIPILRGFYKTYTDPLFMRFKKKVYIYYKNTQQHRI